MISPVKLGLAILCCGAPTLALAQQSTGLANPAAVFCTETGGAFSIETEADGQVGYCTLPDGTKIDAWTYFRENWDKTGADGDK